MNQKNFSHDSNSFFMMSCFGRNITTFVQRVNLPGISLSNIELAKLGQKFYAQADTPTYNNLAVSLLLDDNLYLWREMIQFFQHMVKEGHGAMGYGEFTSTLMIFNERDRNIFNINFYNCLVNSIADVSYDFTSDDQILVTDLDISYSYFDFKKILNSNGDEFTIDGLRQNTFIKHLDESEFIQTIKSNI